MPQVYVTFGAPRLFLCRMLVQYEEDEMVLWQTFSRSSAQLAQQIENVSFLKKSLRYFHSQFEKFGVIPKGISGKNQWKQLMIHTRIFVSFFKDNFSELESSGGLKLCNLDAVTSSPFFV